MTMQCIYRFLRICVIFAGLLVFGIAAIAFCSSIWIENYVETKEAGQLAPTSGHFVHAADVQVFVQELGDSSAPSVVFIHGTGAWSETWRDSMSAVVEAGFHAVAIDMPPFGFSQRPLDYSYAASAQGRRILGVLDALQIKQAILVAHSFGSGPAMEAVFASPDRFTALVLVDAALGIGNQQTAALPVKAFLDAPLLRNTVVAATIANPAFTTTLLKSFIFDKSAATTERVSIYQKPLSIAGSAKAVGEWLPELLAPSTFPLSSNPAPYRSVQIPTFIIWGENDSITPLEQARQIHALISQSELSVLPGVGHIPQIENTQLFNQTLKAHLTRFAVKSAD